MLFIIRGFNSFDILFISVLCLKQYENVFEHTIETFFNIKDFDDFFYVAYNSNSC